jgi:hypothetical protein
MTLGNAQIPCGSAYTVGNATGSVNMIPELSGKSSANANISVLYIPSAAGTTGPEATGAATTQVIAAAETPEPTTPVTPKPTTPVVVTPKPTPAPQQTSPADLQVTIIAVGVIDPYTGAFAARAPYSPSEISAVQFDIRNIGGSSSGSYSFQAQIPTSQPYTYSSEVQPPLAPDAHVVNTLRFTPAVNGTFSVQVSGSDARTSNNYASVWITGAYNGYPQY